MFWAWAIFFYQHLKKVLDTIQCKCCTTVQGNISCIQVLVTVWWRLFVDTQKLKQYQQTHHCWKHGNCRRYPVMTSFCVSVILSKLCWEKCTAGDLVVLWCHDPDIGWSESNERQFSKHDKLQQQGWEIWCPNTTHGYDHWFNRIGNFKLIIVLYKKSSAFNRNIQIFGYWEILLYFDTHNNNKMFLFYPNISLRLLLNQNKVF